MFETMMLRFFCVCCLSFGLSMSMMFAFPASARALPGGTPVMDEVVVTATKTMEKRRDVPNAVVVKEEMDIQEFPARSLGELLANEPGVDLRTRGNYGGAAEAIHIRGMRGDATQVLVNGVPVGSPSLGTTDTGKILLNNIERIEVVKGPGSVLYGSGAMAGTINITTKSPKRGRQDLRFAAGYGSQDTYRLSAEQGMFVSGDIGYYLTASRRETDGFRDNSDLTHNDVSLNLLLDKEDVLDISLYGDYVDREYGLPGVKPPEGIQAYYVNGEEIYNNDSASLLDRGSDEDTHLVLNVRSKPSDWLAIDVRADSTKMENFNKNRYFDFLGSLTGEKTWTTNEVRGIEANVAVEPFAGTKILAGTDYKDYDWENESIELDSRGNEVVGTSSVTQDGVHTKGVYTEIQYRPNRYAKLLAGIRHEDHSAFGSEDLPRFGLVLNPVEETMIKLTHGKHFKAPTLNDLYWPEGAYTRGNPNLKPETGWHSDVGFEQQLLAGKIFIAATYFQWDVDDKIDWAENPNYIGPFGIYKWTPSNVDEYKADGWEFETKLGPLYDFTLSLDYTYTDAEEKKKDGVRREARYSARHRFKGAITYGIDSGLTMTTVVRYVDDRPAKYDTNSDTTPAITLDSYWTADVKIKQRVHDNWVVSLQANNLFDTGYNTYLGTSFTNQTTGQTADEVFYPGAGRSFFLGITYEY